MDKMVKSVGVESCGIFYISKRDPQETRKVREYWRKISLYLHLLYWFKSSKIQLIESAFFDALTLRSLEEAQMLLPKIKNLNVKVKSEDGSIEDEAPLHLIVKNACITHNRGWERFLEEILLKNNNMDVSIDNQMGDTPLHIASSYGSVNLIKILLEHGADINKLNRISESPLYEAACGNHVQAVELLLKYGAKIFEDSISFDKMLYSIVMDQYSAEITTILLCSASIEEKNKISIESYEEGKINLVNNLLSKYKVNLNLVPIGECTTILQKIYQFYDSLNSTEMEDPLLELGAIIKIGKNNDSQFTINGTIQQTPANNRPHKQSEQYATIPQQPRKAKLSPENRLKYVTIGTTCLITGTGLAIASLYINSLVLVTAATLCVLAVIFFAYEYGIYEQNKKDINHNNENDLNNNLASSLVEQVMTSTLAR